MTQTKTIEFVVGIFILVGFISMAFLAFKVSDIRDLTRGHNSYLITANFNNIGDLRVRAPVTISGVKVGEVSDIRLNPDTFSAVVSMKISGDQDKIPTQDTSAVIHTEGLLGSNYINIIPGYNYDDDDAGKDAFLRNGSHIQQTQSALILEQLISNLIFDIN